MTSSASAQGDLEGDFPAVQDSRLRRRIFTVAFVVRLAYIVLAHTYRVRPDMDHFNFGWEMGRIGRSLALGHGYADPFVPNTGPTAWSPPLYTLLIGAVFRLFGIYSSASAFVLEALNSIFSAITAVAVFEIGSRCYTRRIGLWSGWLWALHPAAMQYAVRWIWEMTLTTAIFAWLFVLTLRMAGVGSLQRVDEPQRQGWRQWLWFGLGSGALVLTNPSPVTMLPIFAIFALASPGCRLRRLRDAALAALLATCMVAPWAMRNWIVFHRFIPLRDNLSAENYMGNGPWSTGFPWGTTVPLENLRLQREYAAMGEPAWTADRGAKAKLWIAQHPRTFVRLSIKRAYMFWAGVPKSVQEGALVEYGRLIDFQFVSLAGLFGLALAVRRRSAGWPLFASALVLLPLPYYLVTVQARFRHVLEPLLFVLGTMLFASAAPGQFGASTALAFRSSGLGRLLARLAPWFRGETAPASHRA